MPIPFSIVPSIRRAHRKRRTDVSSPPVAGPVLVSVYYDYEGPSITLDFDRDIDIENYDGTQIVVNDGVHNHQTLNGTGGIGSMEGNQVQIYLADTGAFGGSTTTLTATATTGIRDANDGSAWVGVTSFPV